LALNANRLSS
jgi:hypothetical protein